MERKIPAVIITGASGFVGRSLLDDLKNEYRIFAIARRSQSECNAPFHPNIAWIRADISDEESISKAFREIKTAGGADYIFHLAAFYEFGGENCPEYKTTNIDGTRYLLDLAKDMNLKLFIFSSSVAACDFPKNEEVINEKSPPNGHHTYAWSKRECEKLIQKYADIIPSCIVRFGAVYSDWCEYPPLYMFLNTWLSSSFRSRILAGKGLSAIPYIHIRDIVTYLRQVIRHKESFQPAQIILASPNGSTTHFALFKLATRYYYGKMKKEILIPKPICSIGLIGMNILGKLTGNLPFERPWMSHYIDLQLNIDNKLTTQLLNWEPSPQNFIERRIPFMVERLKSEPNSWHIKNQAALKRGTMRHDFRIYTSLAEIEDSIVDTIIKQITDFQKRVLFPKLNNLDKTERIWFVKLFYRLLLSSVHNNNRLLLLNYIEMSALSRFETGYSLEELSQFLKLLNDLVVRRLEKVDIIKEHIERLYDFITMPIEFAIDELEQQYMNFICRKSGERIEPLKEIEEKTETARSKLEETIWNCLVHRK